MNLSQIKSAVDRGQLVNWVSDIYEVEFWPVHQKYFVVCVINQHASPLTKECCIQCYLGGQ
jgi:hypothetical protein